MIPAVNAANAKTTRQPCRTSRQLRRREATLMTLELEMNWLARSCANQRHDRRRALECQKDFAKQVGSGVRVRILDGLVGQAALPGRTQTTCTEIGAQPKRATGELVAIPRAAHLQTNKSRLMNYCS